MCFTSCLRTSHLYLPLSSISLFHLHCSCHSSLVGVKLMTVWVHYGLVFIIVQQSALCWTCQSWSYTISLFMFQRSKKKKERKALSQFHMSHLFVLLSLEFHIWKKKNHQTSPEAETANIPPTFIAPLAVIQTLSRQTVWRRFSSTHPLRCWHPTNHQLHTETLSLSFLLACHLQTWLSPPKMCILKSKNWWFPTRCPSDRTKLHLLL